MEKIRKVLEFDQSDYIQSYISKCTEMRMKASNPLEKDLFKVNQKTRFFYFLRRKKKRRSIFVLFFFLVNGERDLREIFREQNATLSNADR